MEEAQRVERKAVIPFLEAYQICIGIASFESYMYVFYPNVIQVYEQFPHQSTPELSQELIVSQKRINHFAISKDFIAVVFEDCKLEVRLREHWEVVQYCLNLEYTNKSVDRMEISGDKIILRFLNSETNRFTYAFISIFLCPNEILSSAQTMFWTESVPFDQLIHVPQLGSISNFYLGVSNNTIKFGMFYGSDHDTTLNEFEFGVIKDEDTTNQMVSCSILNFNKMIESQNVQTIHTKTYLVKVFHKREHNTNKLIINHHQFYEDFINQTSEEIKEEQTLEEKRIEAYSKMMNTLEQIEKNKKDFFPNETEKTESKGIQKDPKERGKNSDLDDTNEGQLELLLDYSEAYMKTVQNENLLYISTNQRVFCFELKENENGFRKNVLKEHFKLEKRSRLVDVCCGKMYVTSETLCIIENEFSSESSNVFQKSKIQKIKEEPKKPFLVNQEMQTISPDELALDCMDEKEVESFIDQLLEKKNVIDFSMQTEFTEIEFKEEEKTEKKEKSQIKSMSEISIGENLPMCPATHEQSLDKIGKTLSLINTNFQTQTLAKLQTALKKQQESMKEELVKKIDLLVTETVSSKVCPILERKVSELLSEKIHDINAYMYTLTLQNLLALKEEIEKEEVKENMLRTHFIHKQIHEVQESKRVVAEMMEVCRKREMQKIVVFEIIQNKVDHMRIKVEQLESRVSGIMEKEKESENKIFDEIEGLKAMIKTIQKDETKFTEDKFGNDVKDIEEENDIENGRKGRDEGQEVESMEEEVDESSSNEDERNSSDESGDDSLVRIKNPAVQSYFFKPSFPPYTPPHPQQQYPQLYNPPQFYPHYAQQPQPHLFYHPNNIPNHHPFMQPQPYQFETSPIGFPSLQGPIYNKLDYTKTRHAPSKTKKTKKN